MTAREMSWQNRVDKEVKDEEMRWYHYVLIVAVFLAVPCADPIVEGILWLADKVAK